MRLSEKIQHLKPYAGGAIIGIVVAAVIGFSADVIVTTSTMNKEVHAARTSVLAKVCHLNAAAYWQGQGNESAGLEGWRNEERTKLAEQFTPDFVDAQDRKAIVRDCDRMLRPA